MKRHVCKYSTEYMDRKTSFSSEKQHDFILSYKYKFSTKF